MGILDRLKPQPRWKHADPAIRLEAVRELDDLVELAGLAENDPDARIRRSCTARLSDVTALARIASNDTDNETREKAADRLQVISSDNATDPATALEAVRGLSDGRRLSTIAKSDAPDAVRADALSRISDDRTLGSIARHAKRMTTAADALARVTDAKELIEVAINSDQKDIATSAFDRLVSSTPDDVALLKTIEARSQQKSVAKRARTMIQDLEAAEAARLAAEEEHRRQQKSLIDAMGRFSDPARIDLARADRDLSALVAAWGELNVTDAASAATFEAGRLSAEAAISERRREAEDAAEQARLRAEALATREALCVRIETLDGEDMLAQLVPIEEEWRLLTPLVGNGPEADRLAERFAKAVAACRKRHELSAVLAESRLTLEARVAEAEGLVSALNSADSAAAAARWQELTREARALTAALSDGLRPTDDLTARLSAVADAFAARETAERDAARRAHADVVGRLQRLIERAERAVEAEAVTLREGERLMRDLSAGLDEAGRTEGGKEISELAATLRRLQEKIAPRVRELREMDEWRRFANGQQQDRLIAMAEAIVASLRSDADTGKDSDLIATARALRELNAKWQEVAEGPRHSAQKLWERFRAATDFIRSRCEGHFARLREERGANLQKKTDLVEESEKLAESSDWAKATTRLQELQAAWQDVGPVPRDAARDLAHRFRTACSQFFSRRREDLATRKKAWADSLARKEALCERAEALAASTEWESASSEIKRLQAEWKTIGPVRRNKSEAIWERFRSAADRFFERFHNRHRIALLDKLAERDALVVELETFVAAEAAEPPADLAARVQELRANWNRGVPVPATEMRPLADRWQTAFARVLERWPAAFAGTDLDPVAVTQRMEKLLARVEVLVAETRESAPTGRSQTELLAARLRSALASNAMGGRVTDESKWRTASDTVKDAQAAWLRLPPLTSDSARAIEERFREACRRVLDQVRRHTADTRRRPTAQAG